MKREEINEEILLPYESLCDYLVSKYGGATTDYFSSQECKSKSRKISRTSEGLFCHHRDEDKGVRLSDTAMAKTQPFGWQKKERLVYCNILEHLILHMKIAVLRQKDHLRKPEDIGSFFGTEGIFQICNNINDFYTDEGGASNWKRRCYEEIRNNYNDYIALIKSLFLYIDREYVGEKTATAFLMPGNFVHFSDCDCEILKITKKKDGILLKMPSGEEKGFSVAVASRQLSYKDHVDMKIRRISCGYTSFYDKIYEDIRRSFDDSGVADYSQALLTDFIGHGFPQFINIELTEDYGAKNADEYVAKGLPMYSREINLNGKMPVFFKGPRIPKEGEKLFFIIRIETLFRIKEGQEPFVRYREADLFRRGLFHDINEQQNYKDHGYIILDSTDIFSRKTGKKIVDSIENGRYAKIKLTLGRDDFSLFLKRYQVYYLSIIDGCYFEPLSKNGATFS